MASATVTHRAARNTKHQALDDKPTTAIHTED
jgi:hypothetical protein